MKDLEQLIYALYTHQLPKEVEISTEKQVWEFAEELLGETKIAEIKRQEDPLLELFVVLLQQQTREGNLPPDLKNLIDEYEEHLQQSPAKTIDPTKKELYDNFLRLLKGRHPNLDLEKIPDLETLVAVATKLEPELYDLDLTLRDIPLSVSAKRQIIAFKAMGNAKTEEVKTFIQNQRLWISTEATEQKVDINTWTNLVAQRVGNFYIGATGDESTTQTLFAHAVAAGMSEKSAKEFTKQFLTVSKISYALASYEKTENVNPQQKDALIKNTFLKLLSTSFDYKKDVMRGLQPEVVKNLHTSMRERFYENLHQTYGETLYEKEYFSTPQQKNEFVDFVGFLGNKGLDYVQDVATNKIKTYAIQQFAATEFGQQIFSQVGVKFGTQILTNLGIQATTATTAVATTTTTTIAATGTTSAVTGFLAALGIADPEPISKVIIIMATALSTQFKNIISSGKRLLKNFTLLVGGAGAFLGMIVGATIGAMAGLATGVSLPMLTIVGGGAGWGVGAAVGGGTALQTAGAYASYGFSQLAGMAVVEIATPIIAIILATPIVVALLLFIINNSAYVVPPSGITVPRSVGFLPGCPAEMWPVAVNEGQRYAVTQGPGGPGSHGPPGAKVYEEAIDIFPIPRDPAISDPDFPLYDPSVHLIVATHPGIVTASKKDQWGGNYIYLKDTCGGNFQTSYVHQLVNYVSVGQVVNTGDIIGVMGFTGHVSSRSPAGAHLHYAFLDVDESWKSRSELPPFMIAPFVPKTIPQFCSSLTQCNTFVP